MIYYHERNGVCTSCKKENIPNAYFFKLWMLKYPENENNWDADLKACFCQDCFDWLVDSKLKENFGQGKWGVHNSRCPYCSRLILPVEEKMYMEVSAHILTIPQNDFSPMGGISSCVIHKGCFSFNC